MQTSNWSLHMRHERSALMHDSGSGAIQHHQLMHLELDMHTYKSLSMVMLFQLHLRSMKLCSHGLEGTEIGFHQLHATKLRGPA